MQRILNFIRSTAKYGWYAFSVVFVTLLAVISNFYDLKQPSLELEITSISNGSDEPVDLAKESGLSTIKPEFDEYTSIFNSSRRLDNFIVSQDDISRKIIILKNENVEKSRKIKENEERVYALRKASDSESKLDKLRDFYKALGLLRARQALSILGEEKEDGPLTMVQLLERIESKISSDKENLIESEKRVKIMESEWENYKASILPQRAKLTVSVAIGNSGDGATSLKPQALFRAELGGGNYLDFPMKLKGYERGADNASFLPKTYKVVRFESEEVGVMTGADRERFKMFLGNASPATLFVADVRGNNYYSNSVPFSPGVYEQKAYDLLKKYASDIYN
ncbi:hypothetical protein [Aeromonas allosaccharophila]|uniref:hypothetical protein n=1 Tax=Aeromonas allosaccharophila TaxID=656 RepID=UPI002ADFD301|nr:hypothetical protein [Aeromonas allosaccharophila]